MGTNGAPVKSMPCERVKIADGVFMPSVGLGTWRLNDSTLASILDQALWLGYRLIDTASYYGNESTIGNVLRTAGIQREALFVTTKIRGYDQGRDRTRSALTQSLRRLRLEYVDLLLIHWPLPMRDLFVATWDELIKLREHGLARAIGVSNFNPGHIRRIIRETGVAPAVNQIQCNPAVQNVAMRDLNTRVGTHSQAWEPLGIRSNVLEDVSVVAAANDLGRSPAQIVLRWHLQHGTSVVPKTAQAARLCENLDLFGWELSTAQLRTLDGLDQGALGRVDPERNLVE